MENLKSGNNMKTTKTIAALLMMGISVLNAEEFIPVLSIETQIYVTDTVGVAKANNIIRLKPIDNIKIYLPDGTELLGLVTKTEELNKEVFKVFGDIQNKPNSGFGFVLSKDGIFAGAIVFRDTDTTYTLQYSEEAKGFIFIKAVQKKKILS